MYLSTKSGKFSTLIKNNAKKPVSTWRQTWPKRNWPKCESNFKKVNEKECSQNMKRRKSKSRWPTSKKSLNSIIIGTKKCQSIRRRLRKYSRTWSGSMRPKLSSSNRRSISPWAAGRRTPRSWWIWEKSSRTSQSNKTTCRRTRFRNKYKICSASNTKNGTIREWTKSAIYYSNCATSNRPSFRQ